MKKSSLLLIMGVLLFSLAVTAFVTARADAAPALQVTSTPTFTPTAFPPPAGGNGTSVTPVAPLQNASMIVLWDRVCIKKVPYNIIALPAGATFELVAADGTPIPALMPDSTPVPGQNACKSVLILGDKQVVVCTGQQDTSYTLRVTNGGITEDFVVALKACPLKPPQVENPVTPTVSTPDVPPPSTPLPPTPTP